jgi:hypothetical protein
MQQHVYSGVRGRTNGLGASQRVVRTRRHWQCCDEQVLRQQDGSNASSSLIGTTISLPWSTPWDAPREEPRMGLRTWNKMANRTRIASTPSSSRDTRNQGGRTFLDALRADCLYHQIAARSGPWFLPRVEPNRPDRRTGPRFRRKRARELVPQITAGPLAGSIDRNS